MRHVVKTSSIATLTSAVTGIIADRKPQALRPAHLAYGVLFLLPALWMLGHLFPPLNHDAALILDVAARWIDGERLYVDIADVNPPLIFILSALPAWLARATGMPAPTLFVLMLLGGIGFSFVLSARLLVMTTLSRFTRGLWLPLVLFILIVHPGDSFGQREHLLLIATMPYLLLAAAGLERRPVGGALETGVALLAGIGLALKPHFLLPGILVECYLLLATRGTPLNRRTLALLAGPAAHVLVVALLTPAYVTEVVPLALAFYVERGDALWAFLLTGSMLALVGVWCVFTAFAFSTRGSPLLRVVGLFALGGIGCAILQAKGWSYQSLPATAGVLILGACAGTVWLERRLSPASTAVGRGAAVAILALFYGHVLVAGVPFVLQREYQGSVTARLSQIMRAEGYDGRVMILSPGVAPHFPAVNYARVRPVMPQESLWLLQGLYADCRPGYPRYTPPGWMSGIEHRLFSTLVHALADIQPSLLVVDREPGIPPCDGKIFDFLAYLSQDPRFAAALDEYELLTSFDRYSIYRRILE